MTVRTKRLTKEKVKAQESGVYSDVAPKEVQANSEVFTQPQKEECSKKRRKDCFVANKLRIEALISHDCQLSDIDVALGPVPDPASCEPPTPALLRATDRTAIEYLESGKYSDLEMVAYKEGHKDGALMAIREMRKATGNEALIKFAVAAQKVIHALLQTHEDRISFMDTITPEELASRIAFYFDECNKRKRSYTVPGLAFEVGFMQRQDLLSFIGEHQETLNGYMLARALMKIEDQRNTEIISGGGVMAGHKLDLATNFSWNDAGRKGEAAQTTNNTVINQTNNTLNVSPESLPPTLTLDQWQAEFLGAEKKKEDKKLKE